MQLSVAEGLLAELLTSDFCCCPILSLPVTPTFLLPLPFGPVKWSCPTAVSFFLQLGNCQRHFLNHFGEV